jgi:hypothetical protein
VKEHTWPAALNDLFAPILLVALLAPVLLIASLGHLQPKQVATWLIVVAAILAGLGWYDVWRSGADQSFSWFDRAQGTGPRFPSPLLVFFTTAGCYIAHALVLAGASDRQRIARYPTYFEMAWKLLIQILFSMLFVGVLWLVLSLGAALFMLVKLDFLKKLLQESWFAIPVTACAFACSLHVTDVRPAIVRGIRTLLLVLLSWILPVATLIVGGFVLSLPWTGLAPLWATRHATVVLLGAAAVMVALINAAFQNGDVASQVARVVRGSARIAALLLLPIAAIAAYSLGLRVNEYGWTTDRVIAAACVLVAACYAVGYAWAASRRDGWLAPAASVNIAVAFVLLALLLALFSPVADPARISVDNQMARLSAGRIKADQFDFNFLRFDGARYGLAALKELQTRTQGPDAALLREQAALALNRKTPLPAGRAPSRPVDLASNVTVWPKTAQLPASFLQMRWNTLERTWELPQCLIKPAACDAYLIDLSGDGKPEILLVGSERNAGSVVLMENDAGRWDAVGTPPNDLAGCRPLRESLQAGALKAIAPRINDLDIDGQRIELAYPRFFNITACAAKQQAAGN